MDILCLGSAVVDILAAPVGRPDSWREKQRIERIDFHLGGDAANQCVRLADAGERVTACAALGEDTNGALLRQLLEKRGVDTSRVAFRKDLPTGTALVLVDSEGNRSTFSVKGAHSTLQKSDLPDISDPSVRNLRAVSVASLFSLPLLEEDGLEQFLHRVKEKTRALVFADLANDKLGLGLEGIRRFLPYVDYFLPSLYDAAAMTGQNSPADIAACFHRCGCRNIIIKCGADGCFFSTPEDSGTVPAVRVRTVDTTGAGDCMSALFLHRILAGDAVKEACRYACAGATLSTLSPGASDTPVTDTRIRAFLREHADR